MHQRCQIYLWSSHLDLATSGQISLTSVMNSIMEHLLVLCNAIIEFYCGKFLKQKTTQKGQMHARRTLWSGILFVVQTMNLYTFSILCAVF